MKRYPGESLGFGKLGIAVFICLAPLEIVWMLILSLSLPIVATSVRDKQKPVS